MADDAEKTEEPSAKKIEDARKEGNVPKSTDMSSFITLIVAVMAAFIFLVSINERIQNLYVYYNSLIGTQLTKQTIMEIGIVSLKELLIMVIPLALIVAISGIIAGLVQFGFVFTTKPLTPDLKKIDPIKGFGKLFSMKKVIEGIKITLKVTIVFIIAFYFLIKFTKELPTTIHLDIINQMSWMQEKVILLIAVMLAIFFVFAIVDILIVRYQYFNDLKMSKQEVKDEYKQMEGDPQVKGRIKKLQMELSQKRMMQDIPTADVVITNPNHYAVALRYNKSKENAPRVIASGIDNIALKIKKIAQENMIPIVENPPLARQIYKTCPLNDIIPDTLFQAVAEVLAFVYKSKK